jgi:hypothetical protein
VTFTRTLLLTTVGAALLVALSWRTALAFYDDESSLRLQVTPRETEVFVDGYFAGTVDDYDGRFQRLHVQPGEHELTLYLDGHRKVTQQVLIRPRATFRIRYMMTPLAVGETPDERPAAPARPPAPPETTDALGRELARGAASYGAVAIRVQPAGAEVLIDGERWEGADNDPLIVRLASGSHRIEIRKEGYRPYTTQVDIRDGATSPINVSLSRGESR